MSHVSAPSTPPFSPQREGLYLPRQLHHSLHTPLTHTPRIEAIPWHTYSTDSLTHSPRRGGTTRSHPWIAWQSQTRDGSSVHRHYAPSVELPVCRRMGIKTHECKISRLISNFISTAAWLNIPDTCTWKMSFYCFIGFLVITSYIN